MSDAKDTIQGYLQSISPNAVLQQSPGSNPPMWAAGLNHAGINMGLFLAGNSVHLIAGFGYVPRANVAPLYRQMLEFNLNSTGVFFAVKGDDNQLAIVCSRSAEGLDLQEFTWMLNQMAATFFQMAVPIAQKFQVSQTPT